MTAIFPAQLQMALASNGKIRSHSVVSTSFLLCCLLLLLSGSHAGAARISPSKLVGRSYIKQINKEPSQLRVYRDPTNVELNKSHSSMKTVLTFRGGAPATENLLSYIKASRPRCWVLLVISIVIEAAATTLNKRASDTQSAQLFAGSCVLFLTCVAGFNVALSQIDVSIAYALWSALGTILVSTSGVLFFGESYDAIKLLCIALIISGVVGLNIRDTH